MGPQRGHFPCGCDLGPQASVALKFGTIWAIWVYRHIYIMIACIYDYIHVYGMVYITIIIRMIITITVIMIMIMIMRLMVETS